MENIRWNDLYNLHLLIFTIFALFYVYVLIVLMASRQKLLRGCYFLIFVFTGIVDLTLYLADQYVLAAQRIGLGPWQDSLYIILKNVGAANVSLHVCGNFLMTLCQYFAVCWPFSYDRIWTTRKTLIYLTVVTVAIYGAYTPGWFIENMYLQMENNTYEIVTISTDAIIFHFPAALIFGYVVLSIILLWRTFVAIQRLGTGKQKLKKHHRGLAFKTLIDIVLFSISFMFLMAHIYYSFYPAWLMDFLYYQFNIYLSILYISNPVVLFLVSRVVRIEIFRPFGGCFFCKVENSDISDTRVAARNSRNSGNSKTSARVE